MALPLNPTSIANSTVTSNPQVREPDYVRNTNSAICNISDTTLNSNFPKVNNDNDNIYAKPSFKDILVNRDWEKFASASVAV